ncbi:MAG: hypothetical protein OEV44_14525 [Spirochaetota bacterium]|nr:hypothetical protein [Spirochaetota bacterium]
MNTDRPKRRHLILYLQVYDNDTKDLLGHVANITSEGLMIINENPLETDKDYNLRMILPDKKGLPTYVTFLARALWSKQDINTTFYDTGFQLLNVDPSIKNAINVIIDKLGFND